MTDGMHWDKDMENLLEERTEQKHCLWIGRGEQEPLLQSQLDRGTGFDLPVPTKWIEGLDPMLRMRDLGLQIQLEEVVFLKLQIQLAEVVLLKSQIQLEEIE